MHRIILLQIDDIKICFYQKVKYTEFNTTENNLTLSSYAIYISWLLVFTAIKE